MFNSLKKAYSKVVFILVSFMVLAQNAFAALEIPTTAKAQLEGYVEDNFPVIIGVIILLVGASLLIRLLRKTGG
jgi:hypothetical protein